MMKINIFFEFKEISGGGNQFLRALRAYFIKNSCYVDDYNMADVILINSHQHVNKICKLKRKCKDKIFVHRIDGPIRLYNKIFDGRDRVIYKLNELIADGIVFQSKWSRKKNYECGLKKNDFEIVIMNAPDAEIFNRKEKTNFSKNRKTRLIATSWSDNWNKGFKDYQWLDENLDFKKYEMTFVGNLPEKLNFRNINHIQPLRSEELAKELKRNDIFITSSKKDPCSNSLIEALHCGLPAIGLDDGGHTEIINNGGEVFMNIQELPKLLWKIEKGYLKYQKRITSPTIEEIGDKYFEFIKKIYDKRENKEYTVRYIKYYKILYLKALIFWRQVEKHF